MASHHQHTAEIVPFPLNDYGGVRYLSPQQLARATRDPEMVDAYLAFEPSLARRLTIGERLVTFFARNADRIGGACFALAVVVGCYFAFELGRGAL